jgi:hypothetical protein
MRTFAKLAVASCLAALPLGVLACGSEDDDNPSQAGGAGGTGGKAGSGTGGSSGTTGGAGGTGGGTGGSGGGTGGSGGGTGGSGGGTGGTGGAPSCDLSGAGKTKETIPNPTGNFTLSADKVWTISGNTYVADAQTLTVEPCTRIEGTSGGSLIVSRGGKIAANGTKDEPILFTSDQAAGSRAAGNWGGVVLLGRAPNFKGVDVNIEGLDDAPENKYGGADAAHDCGSIKFARIEFGGIELSPGNEINGLTMGSCGSATVVENVMVNTTLDDCFEWFGGGFTAKNLVCNNGGDDMFDADQGFVGTIENAFGRQVASSSSDPNGFEMDSDLAAATPVTNVTAKNVTLCGVGAPGTATARGMVLRENLTGAFDNIVVMGFDVGVDTRDDFGTTVAPKVTMINSVFFGNAPHNVGNAAETDNDMGFDENAWFSGGTGNNSNDPGFALTDCQASPPAANVASSAKGAFAADQAWMSGLWLDWATN